MENILDIYNIEQASIFPLAIAYQILIGLIIIIICLIIFYKFNKNKKPIWQKTIKTELNNLTNYQHNQIKINKLYIIIKQIIIHIYGRKKTASLSGTELLLFLQENDPNNFAWQKYGLCLINNFSPQNNHIINDDDFNNLIKAIRKWL